MLLRAHAGAGWSPWVLCAGSTAVYACVYGAWLWMFPPDRMALRYFLETAGAMRLKARNGLRALRVGSA